MALIPITEAAELVRKHQSDLYRDVDSGLLQATRNSDVGLLLDTADLLRVYGSVEPPATPARTNLSAEQMKIAVLEERTRSLERALALEAELRKVKDQVAGELRARLADKDNVIKVLESKVLFLEYDKQVDALPVTEDHSTNTDKSDLDKPSAEKRVNEKMVSEKSDEDQHTDEKTREPDDEDPKVTNWWSRLLGGRHGSSMTK